MTIKRRVYQKWYAFFFLLLLNQKFSLPYIDYSIEKKWFIGVPSTNLLFLVIEDALMNGFVHIGVKKVYKNAHAKAFPLLFDKN